MLASYSEFVLATTFSRYIVVYRIGCAPAGWSDGCRSLGCDAFLAYWRCLGYGSGVAATAYGGSRGVRNLCVSAERNKVTFEYELDHKTGHRPSTIVRIYKFYPKGIAQRKAKICHTCFVKIRNVKLSLL